MPTEMTTTTTSSTIKRSHIQQIIDAWNGSSAVPLVLNHSQATTGTPLVIKGYTANSSNNAALVIKNSNDTTTLTIYADGSLSPNPSGNFSVGTLGSPGIKFAAYPNGFYAGQVNTANHMAVAIQNTEVMRWQLSNSSYSTLISQRIESAISSGNDALILAPIAPTSNGAQTGVRTIFRAYSQNAGVGITRDFVFQASTTAADGTGSLEVTTQLNSGAATSLMSIKSNGTFSGIYAPDVTWPPTDSTAITQTQSVTNASATTLPRGTIPVYKVTTTGTTPNFTYTGSWGKQAVGANGYVLTADSTQDSGVAWASTSSSAYSLARFALNPAAFTPATTNGATFAVVTPGTGAEKYEWQFSGTVDNTIYATVPIPTTWTTGTVRIRLYWKSTSGGQQVGFQVTGFQVNISAATSGTATLDTGTLTVTSAGTGDTLTITQGTFNVATPTTVNGVTAGLLDLTVKRLGSSDGSSETCGLRMVVVEFGL